MKKLIYLSLITLLRATTYSQVNYASRINLPDKTTSLEIGTDEHKNLQYRVSFNNKHITAWSAMGLVLVVIIAGKETYITNKKQSTHTETFALPLGKNDHIRR